MHHLLDSQQGFTESSMIEEFFLINRRCISAFGKPTGLYGIVYVGDFNLAFPSNSYSFCMCIVHLCRRFSYQLCLFSKKFIPIKNPWCISCLGRWGCKIKERKKDFRYIFLGIGDCWIYSFRAGSQQILWREDIYRPNPLSTGVVGTVGQEEW